MMTICLICGVIMGVLASIHDNIQPGLQRVLVLYLGFFTSAILGLCLGKIAP